MKKNYTTAQPLHHCIILKKTLKTSKNVDSYTASSYLDWLLNIPNDQLSYGLEGCGPVAPLGGGDGGGGGV
jgi:hypothetical protein